MAIALACARSVRARSLVVRYDVCNRGSANQAGDRPHERMASLHNRVAVADLQGNVRTMAAAAGGGGGETSGPVR